MQLLSAHEHEKGVFIALRLDGLQDVTHIQYTRWDYKKARVGLI